MDNLMNAVEEGLRSAINDHVEPMHQRQALACAMSNLENQLIELALTDMYHESQTLLDIDNGDYCFNKLSRYKVYKIEGIKENSKL